MNKSVFHQAKHRPWAGAFLGAYNKGRGASSLGETQATCPYDRHPPAIAADHPPSATFARGFANAWYQGWLDDHNSRKDKQP